jgi:LysM repeat protein
MYNPEELKIEQGNQFAEVGIPGLNASPVQYVRGKNRVLTMELFFDTYETGEDVRVHTAPIVALLDRQPQTLAPPVLLFSLGRVQFRCVLTDAGQRFTMFGRDGTPVRSTMSVRLQEYADVSLEIRQGLFLGSPTASAVVNKVITPLVEAVARQLPANVATVVHVVLHGDTLSGIAGVYLGDPARWREIAELNRILDPLSLAPGASLVIPGGTA